MNKKPRVDLDFNSLLDENVFELYITHPTRRIYLLLWFSLASGDLGKAGKLFQQSGNCSTLELWTLEHRPSN